MQWTKAEGSHGVPLWIIILAILIGLLLLGLLIYILYKVSNILPVTWPPNPKHLPPDQFSSHVPLPVPWPHATRYSAYRILPFILQPRS